MSQTFMIPSSSPVAVKWVSNLQILLIAYLCALGILYNSLPVVTSSAWIDLSRDMDSKCAPSGVNSTPRHDFLDTCVVHLSMFSVSVA